MIRLDTNPNAIGDVHCLNCGRALAQVVRNPVDGGFQLLPTVNQSTLQVILAGRRLLRCRRCGGRAFVELLEETPIEELAPSPASGAAEQREPAYAGRNARSSRQFGWRVATRERAHGHGAARSRL